MAKIILITHQKGGVGKSTLTFNLAQNFSSNSKVAVLDFDLQGSLSQLKEIVTDFDVIPYVEEINSISDLNYDFIFIDTPPAFNFFTLSALIAADRVLIPFDCDVFSQRALQSLIGNVIETQDDHNSSLEVEGIIVNQFQAQAKLPREVVQQLKDDQLPVLNSMLPPSVVMKESHHKNLPLIHLAADHKLTQAYQSLFNEIEQK